MTSLRNKALLCGCDKNYEAQAKEWKEKGMTCYTHQLFPPRLETCDECKMYKWYKNPPKLSW